MKAPLLIFAVLALAACTKKQPPPDKPVAGACMRFVNDDKAKADQCLEYHGGMGSDERAMCEGTGGRWYAEGCPKDGRHAGCRVDRASDERTLGQYTIDWFYRTGQAKDRSGVDSLCHAGAVVE
jgi:hypothetical protein